MIVFMYVFCLLAWGMNFIAVKVQGTSVSLEVSLTYRLLGAALIFVLLMRFLPSLPTNNKLTIKDLASVMIFGVCNFALSYLLFYYATVWSSAAVVTLIFSMKTVLTPIALASCLGTPLHRSILIGGGFGVLGVVILVYPMLLAADTWSLTGIFLALLGTAFTSIGDVSSARNSQHNIHPIYANAIGFVTAAALLLLISLWQEREFSLSLTYSYLGSLLYLTLIASVLAWLFYLQLINKIGPLKSSYMVVLFPPIGALASIAIGETQASFNLLLACFLCSLGAAIALLPRDRVIEVIAKLLTAFKTSN